MTNKYTSVPQVLNDLDLFNKVNQNSTFSLYNFAALAQNRWVWIFNNWTSALGLKERFKNFAKGQQSLEKKFRDFQRYIDAWALGNKNNPLTNNANFLNIGAFLNQISINELTLSPEEVALKDKEIQRVSSFLIEDFEEMIAFVRKFQALQASAIGLGDVDASSITNVPVGQKQREATIEDLDYLQQLDKLINYLLTIVSNLQDQVGKQPNVLALTQSSISQDSSIVFTQNYQSAIPVPFEISLEHMSKKYLGDVSKWFELVTVNNLQPPYVDESGTKFALLAPPAVNNLIISNAQKEYLAVGVKVKVGSYKLQEEARIIEKIINTETTSILFLSGAQDLRKFKPTEGAYVRIYRPQTTRKGEFVLIPQTNPAPGGPSPKTPKNDALQRLDKAFLDFGVDIYLDDQIDDIVFDSTGNLKLAAGVPAIRQAALNALKTVRGELPFHPTYGVNADIGGRFYGSNDEALIFGQLLRDTLLQDPRFTEVLISSIKTTGTGISIGLIVKIAGSNQAIPLNFVS